MVGSPLRIVVDSRVVHIYCGDGCSDEQRVVSGIVLLAIWRCCIGLWPMLCSLSWESSCNDIAMHHVAAVLVQCNIFAHSPPFGQRVSLERSGFSLTKPLQFLAPSVQSFSRVLVVDQLCPTQCIVVKEEPRSSSVNLREGSFIKYPCVQT